MAQFVIEIRVVVFVNVLFFFAFLTLCLRLFLRKYRRQVSTPGDFLSAAALVCLGFSWVSINPTMMYGTNNMTPAERAKTDFTAHEIWRRTKGSQFNLALRVFYETFLWLQKIVLLDIYRNMTSRLSNQKRILSTLAAFVLLSFSAVLILTFEGCRPIWLYWQVLPDPGTCVQATVWFKAYASISIITDLTLYLLPIAILVRIALPWAKKYLLVILFAHGAFAMAATLTRILADDANEGAQVARYRWGAVECLATTVAVQATPLYGLWRHVDAPAVEIELEEMGGPSSWGEEGVGEEVVGFEEMFRRG